jgi:hypothetical protein
LLPNCDNLIKEGRILVFFNVLFYGLGLQNRET